MSGDAASFGEVLRRLRAHAALSQEELAERAGLSVRGISDLERGARRAPHLHTVRLLADAFGASEHDRAQLLAAARPARHGGGAADHLLRLPHPLTRLVGRKAPLAVLRALLGREEVRLVTLTGAAGIGKTRLAIALAEEVAGAFADGVVFVDLAPLRDPDTVLSAMAVALEVRETGIAPLADLVRTALAPRQILLLCDNFEHLLPAAPLLTELLQAAPGVKALVTSRQPLHVRGEREVPVLPLALPASPAPAMPSTESTISSEAVTLFVERAQEARFDFALTAESAPAVAAIVSRLEGLPLAIELAAAWSRTLSPPALAAGLERRLPLLSGGARDAPARHHSMRAAIAWSYDLLSPQEQAHFRRLGVFAGGFTLEAAAAIAAPGPEMETLERLTRLVDQHLVRAQTITAEDVRYDLLATIREFALERLCACGEEAAAGDSHAAFFRDLVETAAPYLVSADQLAWLGRLEAEHDNLRAALEWTIANGQTREAHHLGAHLWMFWLKQGHWTEGRAWLQRILALPGEAIPALRAEVLLGAGSLASSQGSLAEGQKLYEASLVQWREAGSPAGRARTLTQLSAVAALSFQFDSAVSLAREAMPLFDLPKDETWAALALAIHAVALIGLGDLGAGTALAEEAIARLAAAGEHWLMAFAMLALGAALEAQGEHRQAAALFAISLENWTGPELTGMMLWPLAGMARVAAVLGQADTAARLLGLHDTVAARASAVAVPYYEQQAVAAADVARDLLGDEAFATERAAGRSVPPERIAAEVLRIARALAAEDLFTAAFAAGQDLSPEQAPAEAFAGRDVIARAAPAGETNTAAARLARSPPSD